MVQKLITNPCDSALETGGITPAPSPLATYYLYLPTISRVQGHPFTVIDNGNTTAGLTILFRKSPERKTQAKSDNEWTWKLAALANAEKPNPKLKVTNSRNNQKSHAKKHHSVALRDLIHLRFSTALVQTTSYF